MIFRESALFPLLKVPSVFVTVSMSKLRMAVPVQHGARVVADEVPVAAELAAVGDLAQLRLHLAHDPLHGITVLPVLALTHRLSRGYSEDDLTDPAPLTLLQSQGAAWCSGWAGSSTPAAHREHLTPLMLVPRSLGSRHRAHRQSKNHSSRILRRRLGK